MRAVVALLLLLAFGVRLLIPAGFMPVETSRGMIVRICDGYAGQTATILIPVDRAAGKEMPGGHAAAPCDFAALAAPALGGGDPAMPIAARSMIESASRPAPAALALAATPFLTPPLRGPPILA